MRAKSLLAAFTVTALAAAWFIIPGRITENTSVLPAYAASVDYFLKIEGIDGESTDQDRKGEIVIQSFQWGLSSQAGSARGGKVSFTDFNFTKKMDKSSPILMLSAATGQHHKEAILIGMRPDRGEKLFEIKLTDVMITSLNESGDQSATPTDQFSLNYAKIEFSYFPQSPDGSTEAPVKAGYDLKANKKV